MFNKHETETLLVKETSAVNPREIKPFLTIPRDIKGYITNWQPEEAQLIYEVLEHPNWAPWLEAPAKILEGRARVFSQGQLVIKETESGLPVASLSTNLINWNGKPETLPCWDNVAGEPTDYSQTHVSDGNTLVLMSMNVTPAHQKRVLLENLLPKLKKSLKD